MHAAQKRLTRADRHADRGLAARAARCRARSVSCSASLNGRHASALLGCRLVGVGSSVPETVLTNADLEKVVDTNDEWITSRTGIRKRHVLAPGETLSEHAAESCRRALDMAGIKAEEVDLVLLASSSPDDAFGSACQVQTSIGARNAVAFDLTAACSGFVLGLVTAAQFIRTGTYRNVLVVGADALSRFVDWGDRSTCILFGDGSGAVVLTRAEESQPCALLGLSLRSDGAGRSSLHCTFEGTTKIGPQADVAHARDAPRYANLAMQGQEVFKFAVRSVPSVITAALVDAQLSTSDIDLLVLHQANARIIDAVATRLSVAKERVACNVANYGNTSAASIPLALDEAVRTGQLRPGHVVAMAGFGAGLTWGSAIVRWG